MNEFTMLNFVEMAGVEEGKQMDRLKELAMAMMKATGLKIIRWKSPNLKFMGKH